MFGDRRNYPTLWIPSFAGADNCLRQTLDTERNGDGVACGTPASEGGCGADDCHLRYKRKFHHLRPPCAGAVTLSSDSTAYSCCRIWSQTIFIEIVIPT